MWLKVLKRVAVNKTYVSSACVNGRRKGGWVNQVSPSLRPLTVKDAPRKVGKKMIRDEVRL